MNVENLPKALEALNKIANNYWWSWNQESWELFSTINEELWSKKRNPIQVLKNSKEALTKLSTDKLFLEKLTTVETKLDNYLANKNTWFHQKFSSKDHELIAYFSAEYGIHEALPIYSGGLGVLSGDHVKSASDLGIPMVFVGLFYKNGYFIQQINNEGQQVDVYDHFPPTELSVTPANDQNGKQVQISVELPGRTVWAQVWKAMVGKSTLLLLDTNVEKNNTTDKELTARLYGGDRDMRISQEVILGIGGVKALKELSLKPSVFHMNEGHSGFFQLERIKNAMKDYSLSFVEAQTLCASNCVFTTHTPVPAGNEAFLLPLMHKYFFNYVQELGITWEQFLKLGLVEEKSDYKYFSLTVFAINTARFFNGVSELHGRISKKMWRSQWPGVAEIENPISHITNGVHIQTWTAKEVKDLYQEYMGATWEDELANHDYWTKALNIPNAAIRDTKLTLKRKMIKLVRAQLKAQLKRNGEAQTEIDAVDNYLSEDALTISFARRFATYKRATLIFQDPARLQKIIHDSNCPVQFIFSGKAHPADVPGQTYIKEIYRLSRLPEYKGKIIILENYDMNVSRHLVSGSDVWLNNPRRPMEASGTSGQKVPINFGINFSVLDGWWREGFDGNNGWVIGEEKDFESDEVQDFEDSSDFYRTLEETIKPLYYADRDKGVKGESETWIEKTKNSLATNISRFSTHRMVQDYMTNLYAPAMDYGKVFHGTASEVKKYVKEWNHMKQTWPSLAFLGAWIHGQFVEVESKFSQTWDTPSHHVGMPVDDTLPGRVFETSDSVIELKAYISDLNPEYLRAEILETKNGIDQVFTHPLKLEGIDTFGVATFKGHFKSIDHHPRRLRFRAYGTLPVVRSKFELGLISWY